MNRGQAVAGGGHRAHAHQLDRIRVRLGLDGPDDVLGRADVDLPCLLRVAIRRGRNQRGRMQDEIRATHAARDIVVAGQIAPLDAHARFIEVGREDLPVPGGRPRQGDDIETLATTQQLPERRAAHGSGDAGDKNGLPGWRRHRVSSSNQTSAGPQRSRSSSGKRWTDPRCAFGRR